jgi:hypothetical protein
MSKRRIRLMFDHPTHTCDVVVDIHLPLPEPIEESVAAMADRVRPACPICKQPMPYTGWSFSDLDDDDNTLGPTR